MRRSKKGQTDVSELMWRAGKYIFAALFILLLWQGTNNRILGKAVEKEYLARDIALMNDLVTHLPGNVEVIYDPLSISMEDYDIEFSGPIVIVGVAGTKDRTAHIFNANKDANLEFKESKITSMVWVKKGDQVRAGKVGEPLDERICTPPEERPVIRRLLAHPTYQGVFPGRENEQFIDQPSGTAIHLKEALKTWDFANSVKVQSSTVFSQGGTLTREQEQEMPSTEELTAMVEGTGVFFTVELGWYENTMDNPLSVYYRPNSEKSEFLACLILRNLEKEFPQALSHQMFPSDAPILALGSESAVTLRIGNMALETNPLLSTENSVKMATTIVNAMTEYYDYEDEEE